MKKSSSKARKFIILIVVLVLLATIAFYYIYKPSRALTLVFPSLDKITYINTVIKNDSAHAKIALVLENKNPYKLDIDTLYFEVKLNDTSIADQTVALNLKQSHFDIDTINAPLDLHMKKIKKLIANLQGTDSTNIHIKGFVVYETIFGRYKLDFDKTTRIRVPIPPQIKVLKVERQGFNFKEKTLKATATVEIINKGKNLDLELTEIHYQMTVKNTLQTHGIIQKPLIIKPASSAIVKLPIEIEVYHPLKTAVLIGLDNDRLNYTLHITCKVKENISDKALSSPAEITATGMLELVK